MSVKALITNISRCSFHDGPGVRTVVYLAGCPLACKWCHNPETLSGKVHLVYAESKCIHCGKCISACPHDMLYADDNKISIKNGCIACGKCADICPTKALELTGKIMTASEVFSVIKKDIHYYKSSGGGVTFSGGECLLHPDFIIEVAKMCHSEGIHTAVESAFCVPFENVERVLPYIDLFFADLKIPNSDKHREYTEKGNELIIENIRKLSMLDTNIIIRIPVIPDVNDAEEDFIGFSDIIRTLGKSVNFVELLKYNNLAESKYQMLGKEFISFSDETQTDERMEYLCRFLSRQCGLKCTF